MITRLDHVAIAVSDLEAAIHRFAEDLGLPLDGREDVETASTSTAFFPISGTRLELIHPLRGQGPVVKFLETKGPGLHHVCFETDDIDGDVAKLKAKGYRFLAEQPSLGAHGARIIFLHPKGTDGLLIELAQHTH